VLNLFARYVSSQKSFAVHRSRIRSALHPEWYSVSTTFASAVQSTSFLAKSYDGRCRSVSVKEGLS
jgi:hypothetical protein